MISDFFYKYLENPLYLILIVPIIIALLYFIRRDFSNIKLDKITENKLKRRRWIVFVSRTLIIILLLISLSGPFIEKYRTVNGDPKVKLLIDNSTSMGVFDSSRIAQFKSELEKYLPVDVEYVAAGESSPIGENLVANMARNENILLISDGYSNSGVEIGDAVLRAINLNTTISAVQLDPKNFDASVYVFGSDKTTAGTENTFVVHIAKTDGSQVDVVVKIDGEKVINTRTNLNSLKFTKTFEDGYHTIEARINSDDYFKNNNVFYKVVKVVKKPKVLIFSNSGIDLNKLFEPLYATVLTNAMPDDLTDFTAVVVDNINAAEMNKHVGQLTDFVAQGGGLFVIGGGNSFDAGSYKGSRFEQILPVFVSKPGRSTGETYVVIVIDISGSTGHVFGESIKSDIEKAIAVDMIQNLSLVNRVGIVAFNTQAYKVSDIKPLIEQPTLNETIAALRYGGGTYISNGILLAMQMLEGKGGSKNIILISDGRNQDDKTALGVVASANTKGIRTYTIGVGEDTNDDNMISLAGYGGGTYFDVGSTDRVRILFGNSEIVGTKKVFPLVVLDKNHFITNDLDLRGQVYGFNQVVPKSSSKLLVTTDIGDPLVTAGRLGLGRIAVLATDYNLWGVELLNQDNSLLLTRIANWVIGDPERKNPKFVSINDGILGEDIEVNVKSDVQPYSNDIALYKTDENLYRGILRVNEVGFKTLLDAQFAVNYKEEYKGVGFNPSLEDAVKSSRGRIFKDNQIQDIVDFIKVNSKRDTVAKKNYGWIFALIALIIYLFEVGYRRITR